MRIFLISLTSTYSGRVDGMDGNVKFIIETAPIENDD